MPALDAEFKFCNKHGGRHAGRPRGRLQTCSSASADMLRLDAAFKEMGQPNGLDELVERLTGLCDIIESGWSGAQPPEIVSGASRELADLRPELSRLVALCTSLTMTRTSTCCCHRHRKSFRPHLVDHAVLPWASCSYPLQAHVLQVWADGMRVVLLSSPGNPAG